MDDYGLGRGLLRSKALQKLAAAGGGPPAEGMASDLSRISEALGSGGHVYGAPAGAEPAANGHSNGASKLHTVPIPTRELEVLLTLCAAVGELSSKEQAVRLLDQMGQYLAEIPQQRFAASPYIRELQPSPWEHVTGQLVLAVLDVGARFESLRPAVAEHVKTYLQRLHGVWKGAFAGAFAPAVAFPVIFSFQGFLRALAERPKYHKDFKEQESLIYLIYDFFHDDVLTRLDTTLAEYDADEAEDEWAVYCQRYAALERDLGSVQLRFFFVEYLRHVVGHATLAADATADVRGDQTYLDVVMQSARPVIDDAQTSLLKVCCEYATLEIKFFQYSAETVALASEGWRAILFALKAALQEILCFGVLYDIIDKDDLMKSIEASFISDDEILDEVLVQRILKIMALMSKLSSDVGSSLVRIFPILIVKYGASKATIETGTSSVAYALQLLSQDAVISALYTLVNVLVSPAHRSSSNLAALANGREREPANGSRRSLDRTSSVGSNISLLSANEEERNYIFENAIHALAMLIEKYDDQKITALTISILVQKMRTVNHFIDEVIVVALSRLALCAAERDFTMVVKLYSRLAVDAVAKNDDEMCEAVSEARTRIAAALTADHPFYELYLRDLLEDIVSKGDVHELDHHRPHTEITATACEIALLLTPLARLLPGTKLPPYTTKNVAILNGFRNVWFNAVVHGFSKDSEWVHRYRAQLEVIAWNTPPLISEASANKFESDMELNTVLRRGSSHHNIQDQRQQIASAFTSSNMEVRQLSHPKLTFLSTALLLESLRASVGNCSSILLYFGDPSLKSGETYKFMVGIANEIVRIYLAHVQKRTDGGNKANIAGQLRQLLIFCCHRIGSVSNIAISCTHRLVEEIPSALCSRESLFTLLELLTLLWNSCLDEDLDQYAPRSIFVSARAKIRLELSDSYAHRRETLKCLHENAKTWVQMAIDKIPLDVKGLLQSYLAEMDDVREFDHIVLGRSFAMEMGGRVPFSDSKLASIESMGEVDTNTISDFLAQYTWRQVYRSGDGDGAAAAPRGEEASLRGLLAGLLARAKARKFVALAELRDALLRAVAYLVQTPDAPLALVHYLVALPFEMYTKQAVKIGVPVWVWLMNESPALESRLLAEIALALEWKVREHQGLYSRAHDLTPVMNNKMEYAPSNKAEIVHDANVAMGSFAPDLFLVDMLASHFHACRFGNRHTFEIFERLVRVLLVHMEVASRHPLARKVRFSIVQFALDVLECAEGLTSQRLASLKDLVLSAALTWFAGPPVYPFGGNRLLLKAEFRKLLEVHERIKAMAVPATDRGVDLGNKKSVLLQFLDDEVFRIAVWLDPLDFAPYQQLKTVVPKRQNEASARGAVLAWAIDPALAVFYGRRFRRREIDGQLVQLVAGDPRRVLALAEAAEYLLQAPAAAALAPKHLLYWAPLAPIDAINLFLPTRAKNPFVLQYAMRSLESHDVDVTFFYVPQIVQLLRYDNLGYIARFILETATLNQYFAHQIIWNIKSNAYKDEDSLVPDPLKPVLDEVMGKMVASFSGDDRAFYAREFAFFNEVTSISGKLKPYIKKTKAEKKMKIDEEMAKIKVDVGVYLPSNPDGVVVAIDRKSGRPLQSHAKAPFMATFKIRRAVKRLVEPAGDDTVVESSERWMGAIFKVGDDCRQDMLALQLIALFRNVFNASGLDLYLFPYRVIATAPGCGIIEVLPNSISRDMLGREAVNGLYEYFLSKHGSEDSIQFQQARNAFIQSMAAYSVVSYLLQFKDRHNGNIMYDDHGHILHIDFGFCFDIVPGGVKFEAAPFKLTHEMVQVMGGSADTQAYHWFEELCIKAFLACRRHADSIVKCVVPMLDSGLPCFKGEKTIRKLTDRFVLDKTDKEAAVHMRGLIRKSAESLYTKGYDEFQRMTNGIPY
ncbi:uncharacterized protein V1510DRAFT_303069 [Dipodascopsis tothii]|uniref:uncharacterized protein n=1 Tax=Dipodascopsis tothii TaxID=44089 RepID=UPI0034CEC1A4